MLFYGVGADAVRVAGFDPLDGPDWAELERFLDQELVDLICWANGYALYRLSSSD
jgi:hypothetical protein